MENTIIRINKLRELSGNEQIDFLKHIQDDIVKEVLLYTYDPNKTYKIDNLKYGRINCNDGGLLCWQGTEKLDYNKWKVFCDYLDRFANKRAVKDNDVFQIKKFILQFKPDVEDFLKMVLFKDLRLNMGIKKFQQVWKDFCVAPQVQLADKYTGQVFENGMYSRKFDGKRMYIMSGKGYSRQNKECSYDPIQTIIEELDKICYSQSFVFDGELLYFDENGKEDFQKAISLTSKDTYSDDCKNLYYVIFDVLAKDDFINQEDTHTTEYRYEVLNKIMNTKESRFGYSVLDTLMPHILVARQDKDKQKLETLCAKNKWEGLMYRDGDMPYQFKRTKSLLKIKQMQDGEYKILDFLEGEGRFKGTLGSILIDYKGYQVQVGSGFSDEDRRYIWENTELFKNQYAKVQYFEETKNKDGELSLRFPVFLCIRSQEDEYTPFEWVALLYE